MSGLESVQRFVGAANQPLLFAGIHEYVRKAPLLALYLTPCVCNHIPRYYVNDNSWRIYGALYFPDLTGPEGDTVAAP